MNLLKLSFFLALVFVASSCKDDDAIDCVQSDWVGTYEGTANCDGTSEDVIITITASGSKAIIVSSETATTTTEYSPITPSNCDINDSQSLGGLTISVDGMLDGTKLTIKEVFSGGGFNSTCNYTATRK